MVFLAPHIEEGYCAISAWVIRTCGKCKAGHRHAVRNHMTEHCGNATFRDCDGLLLLR